MIQTSSTQDESEFKQESLPFLQDDRHEESGIHGQSKRLRWMSGLGQSSLSCFPSLHIIILLIYTGIFGLLVATQFNSSSCKPILYSPAAEAIEYEARAIDGLTGHENPFTGYPNPESDMAWADLMKGINIRILPTEMAQLHDTSLLLKDGSGHLATLGAYHELHCIKQIRKWIYRDYYYTNQSEAEYDERSVHADHCLEYLRQSAMCHGDTTINPFRWLRDDNRRIPGPTVKEGALHQCVKWDRLSGWAKSRSVDLYDPNLLLEDWKETGVDE